MVPQILKASAYPRAALVSFLNSAPLSFSNLDWISINERLEGQYCYVFIEEDRVKALVSCEPENQSAAWLRLFYSQSDGKHASYFQSLMDRALADLNAVGVQALYALSFKPWQEKLLSDRAFTPFTQIITLSGPSRMDLSPEPRPGQSIRPMSTEDLQEIEALDHASFSPPWQLNANALRAAYRACSYSTAAIVDGRIIAYQMTASSFDASHLARLAVSPDAQQHGVGSSLVLDSLREAAARGSTEMTVNTQIDNAESLRLYTRLGFRQEGKLIPVFQKAVTEA